MQSETLRQQPEMTTNLVFDFLNLPNCKTIKYTKYNQGKYDKDNIDPSLYLKLSNFFNPYNQKLEQYLNRKFYWS